MSPPSPVTRASRRLRRTYRNATGAVRPLPGFVIIGAQRAGSSSLFSHVCAHPDIAVPTHKEIHFFDNNWYRGLDWYRRHFPLSLRRPPRLTGEASPYYIFHPAVPERIRETLPELRLVAVLRDPVKRAYSQYQHACRDGHETLPFEEALEREDERLAGERERILEDPCYLSFAHRHLSYRSRGYYAEQLERWFDIFPRDQMLVVRSEDMFADADTTLQTVFGFLGLRPYSRPSYPVLNQKPYEPMSDAARALLTAAYREPNRRLAELLGRDFAWSE